MSWLSISNVEICSSAESPFNGWVPSDSVPLKNSMFPDGVPKVARVETVAVKVTVSPTYVVETSEDKNKVVSADSIVISTGWESHDPRITA